MPRRQRRGAIRTWVVTVGALAAIGAGAWLAVNSPLFEVRRVRVTGTLHLTPARVMRVAGVGEGQNALHLSTARAAARLVSDPWVASATVRRILPGTILISVRERDPIASLRVRGRWGIVASDGTVLAFRPHRPDLPVLAGVPAGSLDRLRVGQRVAGSGGALAAIPRLADGIRVARIDVLPEGGIGFRLQDGASVLYGTGAAWREKNAALATLLRWAGRHGVAIDRADVRIPAAPTLLPRIAA